MAKNNEEKKEFIAVWFETASGGRVIAEAPEDEVEDFIKKCYPDMDLKKVV